MYQYSELGLVFYGLRSSVRKGHTDLSVISGPFWKCHFSSCGAAGSPAPLYIYRSPIGSESPVLTVWAGAVIVSLLPFSPLFYFLFKINIYPAAPGAQDLRITSYSPCPAVLSQRLHGNGRNVHIMFILLPRKQKSQTDKKKERKRERQWKSSYRFKKST